MHIVRILISILKKHSLLDETLKFKTNSKQDFCQPLECECKCKTPKILSCLHQENKTTTKKPVKTTKFKGLTYLPPSRPTKLSTIHKKPLSRPQRKVTKSSTKYPTPTWRITYTYDPKIGPTYSRASSTPLYTLTTTPKYAKIYPNNSLISQLYPIDL
jgi:hypothetical protein